jgi:hypothetical protein
MAKSFFDSERAIYNRSQSGNEKSFSFDIEEMSEEERQLMNEAEAILFRLASSATQKTSTPLKKKPSKPVSDELGSIRAELAELRKKFGGNGSAS